VAVEVDLECAVVLGDLAGADKRLAELDDTPVGHLSPFTRATAARFRARVDAARLSLADAASAESVDLSASIEASFRTAAQIFTEHDLTYRSAVVQGELAEWLDTQGRRDDAVDAAAGAIVTFTVLRVTPWLDRLGHLVAADVSDAAPASA
jgi:hypothetical protein